MDTQEEMREEIWEEGRERIKGQRKEFNIIGKNFELIQEDLPPEIHGALDFTDDRAYIGVPIQVRIKKEEKEFLVWKTGIVTSNREMIMLDYDTMQKGTDFVRIGFEPRDLKQRWERKSIFDWLGQTEEIKSLEDVFVEIRSNFEHYMDLMDEREYDFMACWTMMTYYFPLFKTLPILYLNAIRASGKTKLMMLLAAMSFSDGSISPNISSSAFFRSIEASRTSCFIDENERIRSKEKSELKELLNACYKRGAVVKRSEEAHDWKGQKIFQVKEFNVFAPLALASISNIDDVLESRCIRITLQRTNSKKGNREVDLNSVIFQNIRNSLYTSTLKYWETVKSLYNNYSDSVESEESVESECNIYKSTTDTPQTNLCNVEGIDTPTINLVVEPTKLSTRSPLSTLSNRELEMWKPIFAVAKAIGNPDIYKRIKGLALDKSEAFKEDNIAEEANSIIVDGLIRTVTKDDWYKMADLIKEIQQVNDTVDWLKPKILGSILKTLGLGTSKRRFNSGVQVFLTMESVRASGRRVGLDVDGILKEVGLEGCTNQKGKLLALIGEGRDWQEVLDEAEKCGVTDADSKIKKMMSEGVLTEPKIGFIKKA